MILTLQQGAVFHADLYHPVKMWCKKKKEKKKNLGRGCPPTSQSFFGISCMIKLHTKKPGLRAHKKKPS
jgi:hypothetical protein